MYAMVGLSLATGMPWEYFADQDDRIVATYLDILKRSRGTAGKGGQRAAQMSG